MNHIKRCRILILTPRYPYPVIGGDRLRIYEICRELSKWHDLTLLSLCESREELTSPLPEDGVFKSIERIYLPKWRSLLNVILSLPSATPLQIAYYWSAKYRDRVAALISEHDMCIAHLIRTGSYVRHHASPKILEMTDAISLNYNRVKSLKKGIGDVRSLVYSIESHRLLNYEKSIIKDFDVVSLVSDQDRAFLVANDKITENIIVASNGVDLDAFPYSGRSNNDPVIVFIGNMTSLQNLDACIYFCEQVLPKLREHAPFIFRVIGRIKPSDASKLEAYSGVEVKANVSNVADSIGSGVIGVAPIRLGAGVQNKILEYMALGLPVIASPIGFEGLEAIPGEDLLIANAPDEYVRSILDLIANPGKRTQISQNGYAYVKKHHAWSSKLRPFMDQVERLLKPV